MQAPIPPVPDQVAHIQKTRPPGLKTVTLLMFALTPTCYLWMEPDFGPLWFQIPFFTGLMALNFLFLWYFWNGYNWARILVLLGSVLGLLGLFFYAEQTALQNVISTIDTILSVYLLYWLNTKPIRKYFKP